MAKHLFVGLLAAVLAVTAWAFTVELLDVEGRVSYTSELCSSLDPQLSLTCLPLVTV